MSLKQLVSLINSNRTDRRHRVGDANTHFNLLNGARELTCFTCSIEKIKGNACIFQPVSSIRNSECAK